MNSNKIIQASIFMVALILAITLSVTVFTSGSNNLGSAFFYIITPLACMIAIASPRTGFWILVFCGGYLDLVKRLMILERNISYQHIASILALGPAVVAGITANLFFNLITKRVQWQPWQTRVLTICLVWAVLGTFISGGYKSGLQGLGDVINFIVYPFLLLSIPQLFNTAESVRSAIIKITVIYTPVCLYALWQVQNGLAAFEIDYLRSGFSVVSQTLEERQLRVFSTMGGPSQLAMVCAAIAVILVSPVSLRGKFGFQYLFNPFKLAIAALFVAAIANTYVRAAWLVVIVTLVIFMATRYKISTFLLYFGGIATVIALYVSSPYLLKYDIMRELTEQSMDTSMGYASDEEFQAKNLTTFNARLHGMSEMMTNPDLWEPFGLSLAGRENVATGLLIHDFITRTLVSIGYVPLAFIIVSCLISSFLILRFNSRLIATPEVNLFRLMVSIAVGYLAVMPIGEKNLFTFPTNMMHVAYMSFALGLYITNIKHQKVKLPNPPVPILQS